MPIALTEPVGRIVLNEEAGDTGFPQKKEKQDVIELHNSHREMLTSNAGSPGSREMQRRAGTIIGMSAEQEIVEGGNKI